MEPNIFYIWKEKTVISDRTIARTSEPINFEGFNKIIFGLTVHTTTNRLHVHSLTFEHSSTAETDNASAWATINPLSSGGSLNFPGTTDYTIYDFLPYVRVSYNQVVPSGAGSGIVGAEVSIIGHAFESKG